MKVGISNVGERVKSESEILGNTSAAEQPKPGLFFIWDHLRK
jgi:hypothetical protein